jgi:hypothetical protein
MLLAKERPRFIRTMPSLFRTHTKGYNGVAMFKCFSPIFVFKKLAASSAAFLSFTLSVLAKDALHPLVLSALAKGATSSLFQPLITDHSSPTTRHSLRVVQSFAALCEVLRPLL